MGLVNIGKVAKMLNVCVKTVREYDKKGILKSYRNRANNYRMYDVDEVNDFIRKLIIK